VIHVATTANDSGAEVYYAEDKGFFEKAGLRVEIVNIASAGLLGSSVASGAVDIAETGISVIATAHQKGLPFVIIAPAGLYSSKAPTTAMIALSSATFKTGADFAGKTVAVRDISSPAYVAARSWIDPRLRCGRRARAAPHRRRGDRRTGFAERYYERNVSRRRAGL
jgi:ABC-type nitrate/sulfonate/bicarbonate transport system substrate-binding protein